MISTIPNYITMHECLHCGGEVPVDYSKPNILNLLVSCSNCGNLFKVDTDAEFIDGMWRDRTSLIHYEGSDRRLY